MHTTENPCTRDLHTDYYLTSIFTLIDFYYNGGSVDLQMNKIISDEVPGREWGENLDGLGLWHLVSRVGGLGKVCSRARVEVTGCATGSFKGDAWEIVKLVGTTCNYLSTSYFVAVALNSLPNWHKDLTLEGFLRREVNSPPAVNSRPIVAKYLYR